jgi:hypothetical protein
MLHERHADAADHATDALAAGRLGIDDTARTVSADDPPHARLAEIRVNCDFHEYGAERMHGKSLARIVRLHVRRRLEGLADAAYRIGEIAASAACERVLARLAADVLAWPT